MAKRKLKEKLDTGINIDGNVYEDEEESSAQSEVETELLKQTKKFYDTYSTKLTNKKEKINDFNMVYHGIRKNKPRAGLANIVVNEGYAAVETLVADIYALTMLDDPWFCAEPTTVENEQEQHIAESLLRQQLTDISFRSKYILFLRKLGTDGIVFVCQDWKYETKRARGWLPGDGKPERIVFDCFNMRICNIHNIIFNPFTDFNSNPELIEIREVSFDELKDMERNDIAYGIDELKNTEILQGSETNRESDLIKAKRSKMGYQTESLDVSETGKYKIYDYWGKTKRKYLREYENVEMSEQDKEELVDSNISYVNDRIIVRRENPYDNQRAPYSKTNWTDIDEFAIGKGAIEPVESLCEELNDTRNLMLNHKNFALFNIWLKNRNAGIKNSQLKIKQEQIIEVDGDVDKSLKALRPDPSAFQEGALASAESKDDIRRISTATSQRQGTPSTKRQTLGEVEILQTQSGSRIRLIAITIAETFLKPFLNRAWELDLQYMTRPKVVQVIGDEGIYYEQIQPEQLRPEYNFTPKIMVDAENRRTIRASLIQFLEIAGRLPAETVNLFGVVKKIYQLYGFKDVKNVLTPPPAQRFKEEIVPDLENELLGLGREVNVNQWEEHDKHLQAHIAYRRSMMQGENKEKIDVLDKHINEHFHYREIEQSMQQIASQQQGLPPAVGGEGNAELLPPENEQML